jgi:3'(2'), 5'-bisphosphate nucleotidase
MHHENGFSMVATSEHIEWRPDVMAMAACVRQAGQAIMDVYHAGEIVSETKDDESPLTQADRASHAILDAALREMAPSIPVISEEGDWVQTPSRQAERRFWLVDPLDGTKEFIRREKDFTVNVALIVDGKPVWGMVYAPMRDWLYWGSQDGAFLQVGDTPAQQLPSPAAKTRSTCVAVRSKSHAGPAEEALLAAFGVDDTVSMGSSLKLCLVAQGTADVYYRQGPTWEWDTAAGHAVVVAGGGAVFAGSGPAPLCYNKPTLKNDDGFLVLGDPAWIDRLDAVRTD